MGRGDFLKTGEYTMGLRIPHAENAAKRKIIEEGIPLKLKEWEVLDSGEVLFTFQCGQDTKKSVVTRSEEVQEFERYEKTTGKCGLCGGDGLEWYGWSSADGNRFRECHKCNGTGVAT
jgi:hypothetical protein